ncbi:MAG TPA: TetR/AcrR family transcriptional regulator [Hyphomicrobiales bacterium]|nr:TetR/AcrR family transcriptional regulator [Hyphomicrobiales bacterium]
MARPREFDPEQALRTVKDVFWRLGYEGASMREIETATGLNKQSLYRLLGDKRQMYLRSLAHYEENDIAEVERLLQSDGTARERFQRLFDRIINSAIRSNDRRGCFLCNASVDQAQLDDRSQEKILELMTKARTIFMNALAASSPYDKDEAKREALASHLMSCHFGLRVLIKAGVSEAILREAAAAAITSIEASPR